MILVENLLPPFWAFLTPKMPFCLPGGLKMIKMGGKIKISKNPSVSPCGPNFSLLGHSNIISKNLFQPYKVVQMLVFVSISIVSIIINGYNPLRDEK